MADTEAEALKMLEDVLAVSCCAAAWLAGTLACSPLASLEPKAAQASHNAHCPSSIPHRGAPQGKMSLQDLLGPLKGEYPVNPQITIPLGGDRVFPVAPAADALPADEHNVFVSSSHARPVFWPEACVYCMCACHACVG